MPAARRVEGVVAMAWTGRIDLRAGGIRRAAAGRRFVACAGNEVKKQRSGALRLRRRVCEARCGVAADRAQLKFSQRPIWRHQLGRLFTRRDGRGGFSCVSGPRARGRCVLRSIYVRVRGRGQEAQREGPADQPQKSIWLADAKVRGRRSPHLSKTH